MVVVDSLNGQNLDWACDDLNRLVHELARIGEDHCLSRSAGFRISKLDDDSLENELEILKFFVFSRDSARTFQESFPNRAIVDYSSCR